MAKATGKRSSGSSSKQVDPHELSRERVTQKLVKASVATETVAEKVTEAVKSAAISAFDWTREKLGGGAKTKKKASSNKATKKPAAKKPAAKKPAKKKPKK